MKRFTMPWMAKEETMETLTRNYIKTTENLVKDALDIALNQGDTTMEEVLNDETYGPLIKLYQRVLEDATEFALVAARIQDDRYNKLSDDLEALRSFCKNKATVDFKRDKAINEKLDNIIDNIR